MPNSKYKTVEVSKTPANQINFKERLKEMMPLIERAQKEGENKIKEEMERQKSLEENKNNCELFGIFQNTFLPAHNDSEERRGNNLIKLKGREEDLDYSSIRKLEDTSLSLFNNAPENTVRKAEVKGLKVTIAETNK